MTENKPVRDGREKIGVLLFNLGGPENISEVKPFLYNLFADPEIIKLWFPFLNKPLAWLIATLRRAKSEGYYKQIGGGSPQRRITEEQAAALKTRLAEDGIDVRVYVGMVCWHPMLDAAVARMVADGIDRLIVVPLFPHYSVTTTGAGIKKLVLQFQRRGGLRDIARRYVTRYETHPAYVEALARMTVEEIGKFPDPRPEAVTILFSAHSIPQRYVEKGDPYLRHHEKTVAAVMTRVRELTGGAPPHLLSFQSKIGPAKWLEPATDATIRRLAGEGVKQLLAVPVSFVSEHIETLYELDILYKDLADDLKLPHFRRVGALNCRPEFIRALAEVVKAKLGKSGERKEKGGELEKAGTTGGS